MSNSTCLSAAQTNAYLARLGLCSPLAPSQQNLSELVYAHQCTVPFETIDMHGCEAPPSLDLSDLFKKIVTQRRGGYCFELNKLFHALLDSLGYDVYPVFSRVIFGRDVAPAIAHRGIIAALDEGLHYADVGVGGPMAAGALLLEEGKLQEVAEEHFQLVKLDETWWAVERLSLKLPGKNAADVESLALEIPLAPSDERVYRVLEFCLARTQEMDYDALNECNSKPGSLFRETYIANMRTRTGNSYLRGDVLTLRSNGAVETSTLKSDAEFAEALKTYFGFMP